MSARLMTPTSLPSVDHREARDVVLRHLLGRLVDGHLGPDGADLARHEVAHGRGKGLLHLLLVRAEGLDEDQAVEDRHEVREVDVALDLLQTMSRSETIPQSLPLPSTTGAAARRSLTKSSTRSRSSISGGTVTGSDCITSRTAASITAVTLPSRRCSTTSLAMIARPVPRPRRRVPRAGAPRRRRRPPGTAGAAGQQRADDAGQDVAGARRREAGLVAAAHRDPPVGRGDDRVRALEQGDGAAATGELAGRVEPSASSARGPAQQRVRPRRRAA